MFSVRKAACGLLAVALATPATIARASDETVAAPTVAVPGLRASIDRAVQTVSAQPMTALPSTSVAGFASAAQIDRVPLSLPKPTKAHKSTTAVILGLVGTGAGLAATYYMIKTVKDTTKNLPSPTPGS